MRQIFSLVFLTVFLSLQGQNPAEKSTSDHKNTKESNQTEIKYAYKIIPSLNSTWGYDIYKGERMFIHQTNIPGMPGNNGFKTKSDAKKVAGLVVEKLKKGEMPPSVTIDEMKKLKVL